VIQPDIKTDSINFGSDDPKIKLVAFSLTKTGKPGMIFVELIAKPTPWLVLFV
jgi:hypothetical protein